MRRFALPAALAAAAALAACGGDDPEPERAADRAPAPAAERAAEPAAPRGERPRPNPRLDAPLIAAAADGNAPRVRALLRRGARVGARDDRGRTALVTAAFGNHLAAARELVRAGADVNAKDETEQSAYLIASSEVGDDPRLLELTLRHGARVDDRDSYNGTALIRAAERGHPRIVRRLLRAGIDRDHVNRLGWTALHEAIVLGDGGPAHVETVQALVDGGVDVNEPGGAMPPLAHAEALGHGAMARILREAGARR